MIPKTPVFDTATWAAELTWSHWTKVRSGANLFNAVGYAPAASGKDKWDGCVTKNYVGIGVGVHAHLVPGVPGRRPVGAGHLRGRPVAATRPTVFGGNQGLGNYSVGVAADIQQKYRFDLKYIDFVGRYKDNGTAVTSHERPDHVPAATAASSA